MILGKLLAAWPSELKSEMKAPDLSLEITGITDDSRLVAPDFLFVAVPGENVDGHRFIGSAISAGASVVVGERPCSELALSDESYYFQVPDARNALGWLHAAWWGFPSRKLTLIGVTGTDGKTTTTNLLYAILMAAGVRTGMISTVNARIGDLSYDTGLHVTTPPAPQIQAYLAEMVDAGVTHAVLETTSHGLAHQRLAGCDFDIAVVTNITHEHLDFHGTFEAYRDTKAELFRSLGSSYRKPGRSKVAILNHQDPGSYTYLRAISADLQLRYGLDDPEAEVTATNILFTPRGIEFTLTNALGQVQIHSSLVGKFNVYNILAAAAAATALELPLDVVAEGISAVHGVPGRWQRIDEGQDFTAIVDFAHTPNALQQVLSVGRQMIARGSRVIVVFGSAGLRDRDKRRLMGEIAAQYADLVVVTAEDPRTESLAEILSETAEGLTAFGRQKDVDFWLVPDRGQAIRFAVDLACAGDVVLACGKGHEQSMCFGDIEYPWDDREAMRLALRGLTLDSLPTAKDLLYTI